MKMKMLIVDDEYPIVQGMLSMLDWEQLGIDEIKSAYSVEHATEVLKDEPVDIIITDIKMQDGTGLTLLNWLNGIQQDCAKIILTSYPDFSFAQEAISLGVLEYLLKPVTEKALEGAIKKAIEKREKEDAKTEKERSEKRFAPENSEESRMGQIERYIKDHLNENISRDDLCRQLNITPNYLSRIFRETTGLTLQNYIKQIRIQEAQKLLRYSKRPVTLIAQDTGYNTLSYFSAVFKKATSMTPFEYRKQKRAQTLDENQK